MKCPRCQQDNPPEQKFCGECGTPLLEAFEASQARAPADLTDENEGLRRSLAEAHERQTATSEILRVISRSPTDVQPVFDTIARSASLLCGGEYAVVARFDGSLLHFAAQHNARPGAAEPVARLFPGPPRRDSSIGRAILNRERVHMPDVRASLERIRHDGDDARYRAALVLAAGIGAV